MNRGGRGRQPMPPAPESSQPDLDEVRRKADEFARTAYADVFARFERLRSGLDVNLPIVSAIIEREHHGEKEILVQTRWKPDRDPLYSGTLEIPAGGMHAYENVYDAVKREVLEETGLRITRLYPDIHTKTYAPRMMTASPLSPSAVSNSLRVASTGGFCLPMPGRGS